eukprot:PhF_6_TR28073/c0_g1_i1/m.41468
MPYPQKHYRDLLSFGKKRLPTLHGSRGAYRNPIKDIRRGGTPFTMNKWRGSLGVKYFGGMFGARLFWSHDFQKLSPEDKDTVIHGTPNITNLQRATIHAHPHLKQLASFPTAATYVVWEEFVRSPSSSSQAANVDLSEFITNVSEVYQVLKSEYPEAIAVPIVTTNQKKDREMIIIRTGGDVVLCQRPVPSSFDALQKLCSEYAPKSLRLLKSMSPEDTKVVGNNTLSRVLKWYVQNNDPRRHVSIYRESHENSHNAEEVKKTFSVVLFLPKHVHFQKGYDKMLKKRMGFVSVGETFDFRTLKDSLDALNASTAN